MSPDDPQRAKLIEADEIASKIALAETDEQTKRAQVMYCLSATIGDFPADLISNSRSFIDCIDVVDNFSDTGGGSGNQGSQVDSLHCSLFLFDDKLLIVKRPGHGEKGARVLSGLDDMDNVTRSGGRPGLKKSGMSCKGVVDITEVVATDVGGSGEFHGVDSVSLTKGQFKTFTCTWKILLRIRQNVGQDGLFVCSALYFLLVSLT
jgi:hypothetical protein